MPAAAHQPIDFYVFFDLPGERLRVKVRGATRAGALSHATRHLKGKERNQFAGATVREAAVYDALHPDEKWSTA